MELNQAWEERYDDSLEVPDKKEGEVLIGFNTDIDMICYLEGEVLANYVDKLDGELLKRKMNNSPSRVNLEEDFVSALMNSMDRGAANEVDIESKNIAENIRGFFDFDERNIGGQAGISANFLSEFASVILYTPLISEELSEYFREGILYPKVDEDGLLLKNIRDVSNTDKTKKNLIFEYKKGLEIDKFNVNSDSDGRFILSDFLPGYEPLFPNELEEKLPKLTEDTDRIFLSGYQDLRGKNFFSRLSKAKEQVRKIKGHNPDLRIHLEFVSERNESLERRILEEVAREVHSIGCDRFELEQILEIFRQNELAKDLRGSNFSLGSAFQATKEIMKALHLERLHLHSDKFIMTLVKDDYGVSPEKIRKSMLFGGYSAVAKASKGEIPEKEDLSSDYDCHISEEGIKDIEDFAEFMDLGEDFKREGIQRFGEYILVVVPTLLAENSKELVGLGDIISSGSFLAETW